MDKQTTQYLAALFAIGVAFVAGSRFGGRGTKPKEVPKTKEKVVEEEKGDHATESKAKVILLGDVGGTNIRLVLKKVYLDDPSNPGEVLKDTKDNKKAFHS